MPFRQAPVNAHRKLITKYVFNGNTVYQPSTIDMTTGKIGFASPHGLTAGQIISLAFNADINPNYCPNEWFADINYLQVNTVVDANTVILQKYTGSVLSSYATKASVDMTKIHFESQPSNYVTISGFKTTKLGLKAFYATGKGDCYCNIHDFSGNTWQSTNISMFAAGMALSSNAQHGLYRELIANVEFEIRGDGRCAINADVRQWTINGSTPSIADHSPGVGYTTSKSPITGGFITSIDLNGTQVQPLLNGSFVELYDLS